MWRETVAAQGQRTAQNDEFTAEASPSVFLQTFIVFCNHIVDPVKVLQAFVEYICVLIGRQEFGRGSAADCRRHVQKLNAKRGAMMEEQECKTWSLW